MINIIIVAMYMYSQAESGQQVSKYILIASATYEAAHYPLYPEHIITVLEYITGQLHETSFILADINVTIMPPH